MALYTQDQLKDKFRLSRELHLKQREERKRQRQLEYQQLVKRADQLLKEAQQEAKIKLMEQLQAIKPKTPQRALKTPLTPHYNIYNTNLIEREPNDRDLYLTRKALQDWEEANWHCINWSKWEELVNKTRQILGL